MAYATNFLWLLCCDFFLLGEVSFGRFSPPLAAFHRNHKSKKVLTWGHLWKPTKKVKKFYLSSRL